MGLGGLGGGPSGPSLRSRRHRAADVEGEADKYQSPGQQLLAAALIGSPHGIPSWLYVETESGPPCRPKRMRASRDCPSTSARAASTEGPAALRDDQATFGITRRSCSGSSVRVTQNDQDFSTGNVVKRSETYRAMACS